MSAHPVTFTNFGWMLMPVLLYLLAVAVFAQGTSEFVLAGLLLGISADFDVSSARAGLLTSAFAIGMVIGAPLMAALGRGLPPRRTLAGFLTLFLLAHVVGALTRDFDVLFATRVLAALANAGFLAVTLSTVADLVPAERRARALSVILGGTTLALVAGVPAGSLIGSLLGWRASLWAIAAVSLVALCGVAVAAPKGSSSAKRKPVPLGRELRVLARRPLQVNLALGVLVNGATFCVFTYLLVIASGPAGVAENVLPAVPAVFGAGAFVGVTAAGRLGDGSWYRLIVWTGPLLVLGWALMALTLDMAPLFWALLFVQGALSFALGSTLISRIMVTAREAPTMGGSFATVALNLGAVLGPIVGGFSIEALGERGPLFAGVLSATAAVLLWWCAAASRRGAGAGSTVSH
ncbi:Cmx/CmrA family chloramphenicol efflux MFS transporter [Nocardiopsis alba]